jgi:cyclophilin family peptidyl-prolyl cis-trans isomerase
VVAARLVQGGSPGANEYAGWGAYQRDELGLPIVRGDVGVSTRGRDTGDGQFYIDIGDLFELDHNYTVFGHVVEGMDVVDRMQEGALIRRATVR